MYIYFVCGKKEVKVENKLRFTTWKHAFLGALQSLKQVARPLCIAFPDDRLLFLRLMCGGFTRN